MRDKGCVLKNNNIQRKIIRYIRIMTITIVFPIGMGNTNNESLVLVSHKVEVVTSQCEAFQDC